MSPRARRLDTTRLDALVFQSDSVRFEACASFRAGIDAELCACGWLEADHVAAVSRRQFRGRRPPRQVAAVRRTA